MRELVIDTETTGLNFNKGDRIIEVAVIELINHVATGKQLQFYCSTNRTIDEGAEKIHGLSNSFLKKFPTFEEQYQKLINFIKDDTLIIHNAEFDLGFLNHELAIVGAKPIKNKYVDTLLLARKKTNTNRGSLDYLCKRFSIDLTSRKFHGALLDCQLLSEVYLELLGGRQTNLELNRSLKNQNNEKNKKRNEKSMIHKIPITNQDIKQHKDFTKSIPKSLWNKIEY